MRVRHAELRQLVARPFIRLLHVRRTGEASAGDVGDALRDLHYFRNSKVMEIAQGITDIAGGRLTGSPNMKKANEWTRDKLTELGMSNAHLEAYEFGRGWTTEYTMVRMLAPDNQQLYGISKAWSPGTNGPIRGK